MTTINLEKFVSEIAQASLATPNIFVIEIQKIFPKVKRTPEMFVGARSASAKDSWLKDNPLSSVHASEDSTNKLSMYVKSVKLPGMGIDKLSVPYDKVPLDLPTAFTYTPLTITFVCDSKFNQRHYFEQWMEQVYNPKNGSAGFYNDYVASIVVRTLGRAGTEYGSIQTLSNNKPGQLRPYIYQNIVEFTECWPTSISDISLAYGPAKDVVTFDVTFTYRTQYSGQVSVSEDSVGFEAAENMSNNSSFAKSWGLENYTGMAGFFNTANNKVGGVIAGIQKPLTGAIENTIAGVQRPLGAIENTIKSGAGVVNSAMNVVNGAVNNTMNTVNTAVGVIAKPISAINNAVVNVTTPINNAMYGASSATNKITQPLANVQGNVYGVTQKVQGAKSILSVMKR